MGVRKVVLDISIIAAFHCAILLLVLHTCNYSASFRISALAESIVSDDEVRLKRLITTDDANVLHVFGIAGTRCEEVHLNIPSKAVQELGLERAEYIAGKRALFQTLLCLNEELLFAKHDLDSHKGEVDISEYGLTSIEFEGRMLRELPAMTRFSDWTQCLPYLLSVRWTFAGRMLLAVLGISFSIIAAWTVRESTQERSKEPSKTKND